MTGFVARGLIALFLFVLLWKLAGTSVETLRSATFRRPEIGARPVTTAPTSVPDPGLEAALREAAAVPGSVSVAVRNLNTGARADVNAERPMTAASLFKLPVLVEVFKQNRLRRFSMDDPQMITRDHWTDGSGVLQARIGERVPVRELVRLMIVESDNVAALVLIDLVGVENVNQTTASMGLRATRLQDRQNPRGPHTTSASDMATLLETVASGRLVDPATSEEVVRLLEQKQANSWLETGLPWWAKLAHKWGELPGVRHDAGIVFTPRGAFVVVAMTEGADNDSSAEAISRVSRVTFQHFNRDGG